MEHDEDVFHTTGTATRIAERRIVRVQCENSLERYVYNNGTVEPDRQQDENALVFTYVI